MAEMDSPDQADREDTRNDPIPQAGQDVTDAMRGLQRAPRRVDIRRRGGTYSIHFGSRTVANYCEEFSEITGYALPNGARQQVLITVEPIGVVRDWEETPEFTDALARQQEDQAQGPAPDREYPPSRPERGGALARSMAEPEPSEDWRREVYSRLHREIGQCSEMLRLLERL